MIEMGRTALLRMYRAEAVGKTLVVSLQGDAPGFAAGAVHSEMITLLTVARQPEVRNLLVDMSASNYFGSLVLGEIVKLVQAVRDHGGRIALCGVSGDMQEVLRIMKLDSMWEQFHTRADALQAIGGVPWSYRLKPFVKPVAVLVGLLLLVSLYPLIPRRDPVRTAYQQLAELWSEGGALRDNQASETDWLKFTKKATKRFNAIVQTVDRSAYPSEAGFCLMEAAREFGPMALTERLDPHGENTQKVNGLLIQIDALLNPSPSAQEQPALSSPAEAVEDTPSSPPESFPSEGSNDGASAR